MASKLEILSALIVILSAARSDAARISTNVKGKSASPTVSYWYHVLPTTPIPNTLQDLISPLSSEETSEYLKIIEDEKATNVAVGKGGVVVGTPKAGVNVGKGGVSVGTGKPGRGKGTGTRTGVHVGKGGVSVGTGKPGGGKGVGVHVGTHSPFNYNYAADEQLMADPSVSMFFLEKDLRKGTKLTLHLIDRRPDTSFLPRSLANAIPFSSDKLSVVLDDLKIPAASERAVDMKETLEECEQPAIRGESKYCATSLESMVDFSTSKLGKHVNVLATTVPKQSGKQIYTITALPFQSKSGSKSVVCHSLKYAYAVFYCHETQSSKVAQVSLKGEDGSTAEGVAVCHSDTSSWNPQHVAFKALNVKPGGAAVCHFIPEDHVVWLPAN
eukprot:Gb_39304 [translate_table: standard]